MSGIISGILHFIYSYHWTISSDNGDPRSPALKSTFTIIIIICFNIPGESKSHKRAMKMKAREERRKEREVRRMEKNKKKSAPPAVAELGPLGSILRAIIQANTWT